jgi:hypothetical protein
MRGHGLYQKVNMKKAKIHLKLLNVNLKRKPVSKLMEILFPYHHSNSQAEKLLLHGHLKVIVMQIKLKATHL